LFERSDCDLTDATLDPNTYLPILISLHLAVNPPPKECTDEICHSIKPAQVRKTQHRSLRLCPDEFIGQVIKTKVRAMNVQEARWLLWAQF
jgi:hypothetical protein